MVFAASRVRVGTKFVDLFPSNHPYVLLNEKYQTTFGGALTVVVMLQVQHGDIFNFATLQKIQDITRAVDRLPGVNHAQVFSLASVRTSYVEVQSGGLESHAYMYPDVPTTDQDLAALKRRVTTNSDQLRHLISGDFKSATITATLSDAHLDYHEFFDDVQKLVTKYQDGNNRLYVAGEPLVRGWGYHFLPRILGIIVLSLSIIVFIHYYGIRGVARWWAPLMTGSCSAMWGLGFLGLVGWELDPVMLVIPFILTARDVSHGIQWQRRFYSQVEKYGDDVESAVVSTTNLMLPPGLVSILADIFGIIFVSFSGIASLHHIALAGAVWVSSSLLMVFFFQPIVMSYLPPPVLEVKKLGEHANVGLEGALNRFVGWFVAFPVRPSVQRTLTLWAAAGFIVFGLVSGQRARIGYLNIGTPLYRSDAIVNRNIEAIAKVFPVDEAWVVLETPDYPDPQSILGPSPLRAADDLRTYLLERDPKVVQVVSFASDIEKPLNQTFHYGVPKFLAIPNATELAGNLWYLYRGGTAPGETERYIPSVVSNATCIRVLLRDHTYETLSNLLSLIQEFIRTRINTDPSLSQVHVRYLGGSAGLYAAANEALKRIDFINLTLTLMAVGICCAVEFASPKAGLLFIAASVLANFGAFIYMGLRGMTLTIDTIPVVSLGIGLGIDYGIYTVAAIRDEVMGGRQIDESISKALKGTGAAVLNTVFVMVGGLVVWIFSPVDFHARMSELLIFLMITNAITALVVLPCFIAVFRPNFISHYSENGEDADMPRAVAS